MLAVFLPSVQTGFVLPLVRRASQHKGLLFPDATAGQIKTRIGKCPAEVQSLGICVEHIDGSIVRHCGVHLRVRIQKEVIKGFVSHVVIFDFACAAFVVDIVRRVGDDQVGFGSTHQKVIGFGLGAVTADQTVATERPDVTGLGHGGLCQFCAYIEIIIFDAVLEGVLKQSIDLGRLKTSKGHIEVSTLQIGNEQSQLILIPITADFIESNIEGFFLFLIHCHHNTVNLGHAHIHQHLQTLMTANHTAGGLIPDDRFHIAELLNGAFQLFIFRITRLEVFSGIVVGRQKVCRVFLFNQHTRPHSANASNPPTDLM